MFKWTKQFGNAFQTLKNTLCEGTTLVYPDLLLGYVLFTEASKYAWSRVLIQEKTSTINDEEVTLQHPIVYISGLYRGSQLNWKTLVKEAFAIYISCKRLIFYLRGIQITL